MRRARGLRLGATLGTTLALVAGLFVWTPAASAEPTRQNGRNNCAAPTQAECPFPIVPLVDSYTNATDVVQTSNGSGRNFFKSASAVSKAEQLNASQNDATVTHSSSSDDFSQTVDITQSGPTNNITINLTQNPSTGGPVALQSVTQTNKIRINTSQSGANNSLNETANVSQTAESLLDATSPVFHKQRGMVCSTNSMTASANNTANFNVTRAQTSNATGAHPDQRQDDIVGAEAPGCQLGLGSIDLLAHSAGTNLIKLTKATDTKTTTARSLDSGLVRVVQGVDGGGWLFKGDVNSGVANGDGACDVDLGAPGGSGGLRKIWSASAVNALGGSVATDVDQLDEIRIPFVSKSPFCIQSNSFSQINGPPGAVQLIRESANGFAKTAWTGQLHGRLDDGGGVKEDVVPFGPANNIDASLNCTGTEQNTDTCTGTLNPASQAHMAVRNPGNGESFGGPELPSSTSANPGQTVEIQGTLENSGAGDATGANFTWAVPAGMTFVSGTDCAEASGTVTCSVGNLPAGTPPAIRTFLVSVNADAALGPRTTHLVGDTAEEDPFDSNDTTVNVTAPPTLTVKIKIYPSAVGGSAGNTPVAMLSQADDNNPATLDNALDINPSTVCFARTTTSTTKACNGTVQSTSDVSGDGRPDLKMSFNTLASGVLKTDKSACITGKTFSGQNVQGCGSVPKN